MGEKKVSFGCRICVRGLPEGVKKTTLQGAFDEFGRIVKIEVPQDKPGIAFIEFEDKRDASDAVKDMDGSTLEKQKISVTLSDEKPKVYTAGHPVGETAHGDYVAGMASR